MARNGSDRWLLDTNILAELRRPRPDHRVIAFVEGCPLSRLYISTVTLAEIRFGIERTTEPDFRGELNRWLTEKVRPMFAERILEITEDIMLRLRLLVEKGRKTGRTFSQPDLILAATALEHGLMLVTRDEKDFPGLGVPLLNPWNAASQLKER